MLVRMQLALPRDARHVSLMRDVAECVLSGFEVPGDAVDDVKLAVTEACANAVRHASGSAEYAVRLGVSDSECEIEVIDTGPGFKAGTVQPPDATGSPDDAAGATAPNAAEFESGRGLVLVRALVDDLQFIREHNATRVRLVKRWHGLRLRSEPAVS